MTSCTQAMAEYDAMSEDVAQPLRPSKFKKNSQILPIDAGNGWIPRLEHQFIYCFTLAKYARTVLVARELRIM